MLQIEQKALEQKPHQLLMVDTIAIFCTGITYKLL